MLVCCSRLSCGEDARSSIAQRAQRAGRRARRRGRPQGVESERERGLDRRGPRGGGDARAGVERPAGCGGGGDLLPGALAAPEADARGAGVRPRAQPAPGLPLAQRGHEGSNLRGIRLQGVLRSGEMCAAAVTGAVKQLARGCGAAGAARGPRRLDS